MPVAPSVAPSWTQQLAQALAMREQAKQQRSDRAQQESDRQRSRTLQDIGLAKEGVHLTQPGELPPQMDFNVSGGPNADDIVSRALMPVLAGRDPIERAANKAMPFQIGEGTGGAMPSRIGEHGGGPMSVTASRNLSFGPGYYVDHDEQADNQRRGAEAHMAQVLAEALGKAKAEETVNPGGRQTETAYKQALTKQALAQALKAAEPTYHAPAHIDPLSPEGIKATRGLKAYEASLKPDKSDTPQKPTEFSGKAALVTPKAVESAKILDRFYTTGVPASQGVLGKIPMLGNYAMSPEQQSAQQAAEAVSMAILRLESGASISDQEMKNQAKQITPLPGDSPEVLAQKRQTLQTILTRMQAAAEPSMRGEKAPILPRSAPRGDVDLRDGKKAVPLPAHVQTIDEMIQSGKSDAEIKAAMRRGVK